MNPIAPGFFLTKQNEKLLRPDDGAFTERAEKILTNTPMDRFGQAEELFQKVPDDFVILKITNE